MIENINFQRNKMEKRIIRALQSNDKHFQDMSEELQKAAIEIGKPNFLFFHKFDHKWCEQRNGLTFSPNYAYRLRSEY
jgi:hypothetical protein